MEAIFKMLYLGASVLMMVVGTGLYLRNQTLLSEFSVGAGDTLQISADSWRNSAIYISQDAFVYSSKEIKKKMIGYSIEETEGHIDFEDKTYTFQEIGSLVTQLNDYSSYSIDLMEEQDGYILIEIKEI